MTNSYMNGQAGTETGAGVGLVPMKRKRGRPRKTVAAPESRPVTAVIAREFWDMSKGKIVGWFSAAIMALVAGGWIMLPAKQSDLDALRTEVRSGFAAVNERLNGVSIQMDAANARLGEVRNAYEAIRGELMGRDAQEVRRASSSPPAPIAPIRPRRAPAPSPVPEKTPNIFGF